MDKEIIASVIFPVRNQEKFLEQSITSVINQKIPKNYSIEIIIINDGSIDNSYEIIKKYQNQDQRIKIINNQTNLGIASSLNKGIELSQGKYIIRMDADDICIEQRFAKQIEFMEKHPDIGICGSAIIIIDQNDKEIGVNKYLTNHQAIKSAMILDTAFAHPSVIIRKSVLQKHQLKYNEEFKYAQDFELFSRLIKFTKGYNLKEKLLKYRVKNDTEKKQLTIKFCDKIRKRILTEFEINEQQIDQNLNALHCLNYRNNKITQSQFEQAISMFKEVIKFTNDSNLASFLHKRFSKIIYRKLIHDPQSFRNKINNFKLINDCFLENKSKFMILSMQILKNFFHFK